MGTPTSSKPPRSGWRTRTSASGCVRSSSSRRGPTLTEEAIKDYVRDHLARYKVPREVVFLAELPRNPTGKILKRELRQIEIH